MMDFECWIIFFTLTAVNDPVRVKNAIAQGLKSLITISVVPMGLGKQPHNNPDSGFFALSGLLWRDKIAVSSPRFAIGRGVGLRLERYKISDFNP
jgi:hypothetical protein